VTPGGTQSLPAVTFTPSPRPRRRGLGCLPSLVLLLVFCLAVAVAVDSIIGPWIYTVGGRHRWLPVWEGVGEAHGPGGTYRLYVWFAPANAGQRILPEAAVAGYSTLCTPRGERFNLKLAGGASGRMWLNMADGQAFGLRVFRRVAFGDFTGRGPIDNPRLQFSGHWQGPDLVMDDGGSFAHAFAPDGTLLAKAAIWHPHTSAVRITFTERYWGLISPPPCTPAR
jgi:hypothetical protein